ncbi:hypothetical protein M9458_034548, partial [Cirrhinus mrigala]
LQRHALKHASLESRVLFEEAAAHLNCFQLRSFYFWVRGRCDELSDVLPGTSPQTAHPVCLPMECPDDFESSSQYGLDLLKALQPWLSCRYIKPRFVKICTRVNCVRRPTMLYELRRVMSTMVVQEHHLWLNLAEMRDAKKVRFLDAPISQAGLFGETVEDFAQQFSTVKKQKILAENFSAWLSLPNPSRWLLWTIWLGYAIQFARRPPKFCGVLTTSVRGSSTTFLCAEIAVLLVKNAIETVPSAEMKKEFYSPYFTVPKMCGGLRPILDLRVLNRALLKLLFKMLTLKHILKCVRTQDWFVAIDLKDAYFYVSILPRHRSFLRFAFEGRAYQYKVLPFSISLSPRVFTKVAEAALALLRELGIRILDYLDDWLILAHSWDLVRAHMASSAAVTPLGLQIPTQGMNTFIFS